MFGGVLITKQRYDQCSDKVRSQGGLKMLPSEGGEGRFAKDAAAAEDWPGDIFFLRLVTLVIGNLCFFLVATSIRVGAS